MQESSIKNSVTHSDPSSKGWTLVIAGYSTAAVGLVAFLTINGASGTPAAATIGTAILIAVGLLLPAAGMLQLRTNLGPIESAARKSFAMQAFGLLGLLIGVVVLVAGSSLLGYFVSAAFVVTAGMLAIAGAVVLRRHYIISAIASSNTSSLVYLIFGMALIFSGVGLIVGSNIAYQFLLFQMENTIYVDLGTTISACGCVLAAYSFFVLQNSTNYHKMDL